MIIHNERKIKISLLKQMTMLEAEGRRLESYHLDNK